MEVNSVTAARIVTSAVALGLVGVSSVYLYQHWIGSRKPKKRFNPFVPVGEVKKIFLYPVKSLKPIECDQVRVDEHEVISWEHLKDRAFVLVNGKNIFLTQRREPELVLLDVQLTDGNLAIKITSPDGKSITVPLKLDEKTSQGELEIVQTKVWDDDVKGIDCGLEVSRFFSDYLGKPNIRLLRFDDTRIDYRPSQVYHDGKMTKDSAIKIMYQDSAPVLIINNRSIETLNSWLTEGSVDHRNFRPNILIEAESFDEDQWENVIIGATQWRQLKKCTRCIMTTVNTENGTFMKEPMVTLKRYRNPEGKDSGYHSPLMGVFFTPETNGIIKIGDQILASHKI